MQHKQKHLIPSPLNINHIMSLFNATMNMITNVRLLLQDIRKDSKNVRSFLQETKGMVKYNNISNNIQNMVEMYKEGAFKSTKEKTPSSGRVNQIPNP